MDAVAPTSSAHSSLPALPAPSRPPMPEGPAPRSAPAPATPAPSLEAPPLPLSVQREQLKPPAAPLMTGEQMSALLNAVLHGGAGVVQP